MTTRLIIAEEHGPTREAISSMLFFQKGLEALVITDATADSVVRLLEQFRPDIVALGIGLQLCQGIKTVHRLVASDVGVKVLVLGLYSDRSMVRAILDAGAHGYLAKDLICEKFAEAIHAVTSGKAYVCSTMASKD